MKEILFKGFSENKYENQKIFINNEWVVGKWIEGFCYELNGNTYIIQKGTGFFDISHGEEILSTAYCLDITPETLSQFTGLYCTNNKNSKIFQNDIVEITLHNGAKYRYLIWFCQEVCEVTAIDIQYIEFNGYDYHDYRGNDMSIGEFSVMLQDHYGHIKEVKVIGNVFDNPELLNKEDKTN